MIYEEMLKQEQLLEQKLKTIQKQLESLPDGTLICTRNGNRYKWYQSKDHAYNYIPKSNLTLAEQLARKKYLSLLFSDILHEKEAIHAYLEKHNAEPGQAEQLLIKSPEFRRLLSPTFAPLSKELYEWAQAPFDSNPLNPEKLIIKTVSGHLVRSKSEALIDMVLHTNKIPFRYECALHLGNCIVYPDFTIRHPRTGDTYYWEHFGMMDFHRYSKKTGARLQQYIDHNITPSIQLITTYETDDQPLSPELIEKIVRHYFL